MILKNNIKLLNFFKFLFFIIILFLFYIINNNYIFATKEKPENNEKEEIDDKEVEEFYNLIRQWRIIKQGQKASSSFSGKQKNPPWEPKFIPEDFEFVIETKKKSDSPRHSLIDLSEKNVVLNPKRKFLIEEKESSKKIKNHFSNDKL
ncbi:hypothetical protein AXA84_0429 [Candidatus Phytoplasma oryzae]|uniref:Uncharacterized protein n=1 Tax=Candidatus Phytoplasma oryzae TaxID=203274 RepID=A0A139JQA9_9MOLU|nr:hypothetical protein [Candidatus Phytoplasma oryzae]KXT29066.1 hypothetical protein AXA84_0429 [Candidatus Phytoplasma oryzae]